MILLPILPSLTDLHMRRWSSLTWRMLFVVGCLALLSIVAMPRAARRLNEFFYGSSRQEVPQAAKTASLPQLPPPTFSAGSATPASHHEPLLYQPLPEDAPVESPAASLLAEVSDPPPVMEIRPDFLPPERAPDQPQALPDVGPLDEAAARQIGTIRQRLEDLGAEYVRLEMSADGREYYCLCEMLLGEGSRRTQPFEAKESDPVAAAEAVLSKVEAWRSEKRGADVRER